VAVIGVTVGVGSYRGLAEQAAQSFSQRTGLRCIILGDKEYGAAGLTGQLPELLKLRVWDFVDANAVLLFDADMVCLRPWDPGSMSAEATMVATRDWIWRSGIVKEAENGAVPLNEYFLASLMILNRDHHREMLRMAEQLFPHIPSNVMAQTAINAARSRLGIPITFLDRRYNWSLFGEGNLHSKAAPIVAHYNTMSCGQNPLAFRRSRPRGRSIAKRSRNLEIGGFAIRELAGTNAPSSSVVTGQ
jgi:hypothetical protein